MTAITAGRRDNLALRWGVFWALAVGGLFYVKWFPYYNKAFVAAANHAIGPSILMGAASAPPAPSLDAAISYALAYGKAIWQAMVLGLLLGSAIQALLPAHFVARVLGTASFGGVAAGGLLALPSMMCTCCAAPVVVGLRERRASAGAAIAFWLGNTVLNPATLVFIGFVLGWRWAALRLALGVAMVFGLGILAGALTRERDAERTPARLEEPREPETSAFARWLQILGRMSLRLIPEYVVLVLLMGAARAWLFPHAGPEVGNALIGIAGLAVAGMLFVIPTAGEVPILQAMLALGVGAGPAGALLMTLPPVSLPSLAMVWGSFPARVLGVVAAGVIAFGIIGGLAAAWLGF
jgi:uncharacterized membrane protein YraQ (UPF0718 family)